MQFVFSYSSSEMFEHSLCIHISLSHTALPHDHSRLRGCTVHSPLCSLRNTKYQFPIHLFQTPHCQVLNELRLHKNTFNSLHTPPPYLMFYSTFCKAYTETWGLGSFQYDLPTLTVIPSAESSEDLLLDSHYL